MKIMIPAAFIALGVTAGIAALANAAAAVTDMSGHSGDINVLLARAITQALSR